MTLVRRLKKLEAGTRDYRILFVPDGLSWDEREALVEAYRRDNNLPPETTITAIDEADRGV
jgi:hypothetical protein